MKKKILKFILTIVICVGIGFGIGELISLIKLDSFNGLSATKIICITIAFIIALVVSVTIHEMAHALYFIIHGIPIRLFAVFFFVLITVQTNGIYCSTPTE